MVFLIGIAILGGAVGIVVAVVIAVWVTKIWSPAAWREEARLQRVLRGEFELDGSKPDSGCGSPYGRGYRQNPWRITPGVLTVFVVFIVLLATVWLCASLLPEPIQCPDGQKAVHYGSAGPRCIPDGG